ncbi:MAG: GHKL domain-containing protein [Acidobacteria bacterium]|nr:GHKL domain-containing protein [Acidobacteriota bacterium]MBI3655006.1 GHKL domain-containing protein [Acidobacteriota bacterium]
MQRIGLRVSLIALMMTGAFGVYETVKTLLFPRMTVITSHVLTTLVVGALTFVTMRYMLLRYQQLTAATERTNQLLQAVLVAMREGVLILNPDGTVALYNPTLKEIFKWSKNPAGALRLTDITNDPIIHKAFHDALHFGRSSEDYVRLLTPESSSFQVHITPLTSVGGRAALGAVGVLFDISKLERLERVRREFFDNLSHELRTPLTAILVYVETLLDGAISDPENNVPFLKIVQKHALRMQALARDIADLSAIEIGHVRLEPTAVNLVSLVDTIFSLARAQAEAAGVTLVTDIPCGLQVTADPHRLEQILSNLVDNAIKFNHKGGAVRVTAHAAGSAVAISVNDTGIGMAPDDCSRIFERFYRVDKSRSRAMGGSGLGLAIVKHLVNIHGGEIHVESTPNRGSTFTLKLPGPPDSAHSTIAPR